MLEQFLKVKAAIDKASVHVFSCVQCHDGVLYGTDGRFLTVAMPVESTANWAVNAEMFEKAVKAFKTGKMKVKASKLEVRQGRSHISLGMIEDAMLNKDRGEGTRFTCGPDFVKDLLSLMDFVGDNHINTWQCGVTVTDGRAWCTDGKILIGKDVDCNAQFTVPQRMLDYLRSRKETLDYVMVDDKVVIWQFIDGSWARMQRLEDERFTLYNAMVVKLFVEPTFLITDEMKTALLTVCDLAEVDFTVGPNGVSMISDKAEAAFEFESGLVHETKWTPKNALRALKVATHIEFDQKVHASFRGGKFFGVMVGRQ